MPEPKNGNRFHVHPKGDYMPIPKAVLDIKSDAKKLDPEIKAKLKSLKHSSDEDTPQSD